MNGRMDDGLMEIALDDTHNNAKWNFVFGGKLDRTTVYFEDCLICCYSFDNFVIINCALK